MFPKKPKSPVLPVDPADIDELERSVVSINGKPYTETSEKEKAALREALADEWRKYPNKE